MRQIAGGRCETCGRLMWLECVYICECVCICVYMCVTVCMRVNLCVHAYICVYVCVYVCDTCSRLGRRRVRVYMCVCVYICVRCAGDYGEVSHVRQIRGGRCDTCGILVGLRCDTCDRLGC